MHIHDSNGIRFITHNELISGFRHQMNTIYSYFSCQRDCRSEWFKCCYALSWFYVPDFYSSIRTCTENRIYNIILLIIINQLMLDCLPQYIMSVWWELGIVNKTCMTNKFFDKLSRFETVHSLINIILLKIIDKKLNQLKISLTVWYNRMM